MNRLTLAILSIVLLLSSCTTNYFLVVSDTDTPIYSDMEYESQQGNIQAGTAFLYKGNGKAGETQYGIIKGYSSKVAGWKSLKKLSKKQIDELVFTTDYGYTYWNIPTSMYRYGRLYQPTTTTGTRASSSKPSTSSGGTVHVKGYTRKDGTYVQPHTRSAPRRH